MEDTNKKKHDEKVRFYTVIFAVVCIALILYIIINWGQSKSTAHQKKQETEVLLTKEHGDEARSVILHFEQTWFSIEMHKDPEPYLRELLAGPLLDYYLKLINNLDSDYWLIPGRVDVIDLKVVEYGNESMKVITCLNQGTDKVTRDGTILESYPIRKLVKLFILIKTDDSWKIGNVIDMTDPKQALQDWDYTSQDLKSITGDIGSLVYNSCQINE